MSKALTLTAVFKAGSLNYGEGISNISELKKIHRSNGEVYTFASRQSIRYDIVRLGNELFGWNLDTVDKDKGTVQFKESVSIKESVEMDLFGYLKTGKKSEKRPAVARLSHAFSMESYYGDMEFLNNMGLAERINENPNLANIEQHESLYTYTVTIDLNRVGVDGDTMLTGEEKADRIIQLLDILKVLNRNIRGRQENLAPLFVIGGIYNVANPFFLGRVKLKNKTKNWELDMDTLCDAMETSFAKEKVKDNTWIGFVKGNFGNEAEFTTLVGDRATNVEVFFNELQKQVNEIYRSM